MILDAASAIIATDKLRDYLLSSAHPIGRYKSAFFRSLGYTQDTWDVLERDLRSLLSNDAQSSGVSQYGEKFVVRGTLSGPTGRSAMVLSVWSEAMARFVTAYPEE